MSPLLKYSAHENFLTRFDGGICLSMTGRTYGTLSPQTQYSSSVSAAHDRNFLLNFKLLTASAKHRTRWFTNGSPTNWMLKVVVVGTNVCAKYIGIDSRRPTSESAPSASTIHHPSHRGCEVGGFNSPLDGHNPLQVTLGDHISLWLLCYKKRLRRAKSQNSSITTPTQAY